MSLIAEVKLGIGGKMLSTVEIKRRGPYGPKGSEKPDDVFRYVVRVNDVQIGHVFHRHGDNSLVLVGLAIRLWSDPERFDEGEPR